MEPHGKTGGLLQRRIKSLNSEDMQTPRDETIVMRLLSVGGLTDRKTKGSLELALRRLETKESIINGIVVG